MSFFLPGFLHVHDWEAASRVSRVEWSEEWEYGGVFLAFQLFSGAESRSGFVFR